MFAERFDAETSRHTVLTVSQAGWAGINNGKLLRLIANSGKFDVFLTVDKRLPQQNQTRSLSFAIVVLRAQSNRMVHLFPFAPEILRRLAGPSVKSRKMSMCKT